MKYRLFCFQTILSLCFMSAAYASDFEMEALPAEGKTIAGGPVVIEVTIRYTGREPIVITQGSGTGGTGSIIFMEQGFLLGTPAGWKKRKQSSVGGTFSLHDRRLQPGDVIRKKLLLHYCFSEIPAGKATVELSYGVAGPNGVGGKLLAELSASVELDVIERSPAELRSLFSEIMKVVRNSDETHEEAGEQISQNYGKKLNACRQLIWTEHESVVPFLLEILQNDGVSACHQEARASLYSLSRNSNSVLDALVDGLQKSGTERDARFFFGKWKHDKVDIGQERILKLLQSPRECIRDAARETFGHNVTKAQPLNQESKPAPNLEKKKPDVPTPEQPVLEPEEGTNWLLPGLIVAVVVLAGVMIFLLLRGRKASQ